MFHTGAGFDALTRWSARLRSRRPYYRTLALLTGYCSSLTQALILKFGRDGSMNLLKKKKTLGNVYIKVRQYIFNIYISVTSSTFNFLKDQSFVRLGQMARNSDINYHFN